MLPNLTNRSVFVGSTGSGKTQAALYFFVKAYGDYFGEMPFIIFDFKGDELIEKINPPEISLTSPPPKSGGLYVVRPLPNDDDLVNYYFMKIWEQEDIGLYIDETTMVPKNSKYFRACQTQGRSKHIPMIMSTQRPVNLDKYVFTEASYFAIFRLNNGDDRKKMKENLDGKMPALLPDYHFQYYDVGKNTIKNYSPVPNAKTIVEMYKEKMPNGLRKI